MTTFAISVDVDPDELRVVETPDNFGAFQTREEAAQRLIEIVGGRMEVLRRSKNRAALIVRSAARMKLENDHVSE